MKILKTCSFLLYFCAVSILSAASLLDVSLSEKIIADFSEPTVTSGGAVIPYFHNPISCGVSVYQAEAKILEPDAKKKILYTADIGSCQVLIIRNPITKKTGLYHLDQFFNMEGIAEVLDSYKSEDTPIAAQIIINQNYFDTERGVQQFQQSYGNSVDEHLAILSQTFETTGVMLDILRLSSPNISERLRPYIINEGWTDAKMNDHLAHLSYDIPGKIGVHADTGEIFWWSLPLTRRCLNPKIMAFYDQVKQKKRQQLQLSMSMKISYSLSDMLGASRA